MNTVLRITGQQHKRLQNHLFPGDGLEAVAIALCGRHTGKDRHILTVQEIFEIPYDDCSIRTATQLKWSTEKLLPILEKAEKINGAIVKIHSHPTGFPEFSETDNLSDRDLFPSIYGWIDSDNPHGSCVMLPNGKMFGRIFSSSGSFEDITTIAVAGEDLHFWHSENVVREVPEFAKRHAQALGKGTFDVLRKLSIAVIGASGSGSPTIEQLARLGVGKLVIVDPDIVEEKNLNRILNSTLADAQAKRFKVDVIAKAVKKMGTGTEIIPLSSDLYNPEIIKEVANCDAVFGCMDTITGRHLLNRISVFYSIPYFDIGIGIIADGKGGVEQICGSVHYIQPDRSSLLSRGLYTLEKLSAESLKLTNPEEYKKQEEEGYIQGVQEDRPAVVSVNMQFSSMAINEFLARIHHFRDDGNSDYAVTRYSLTQSQFYNETETGDCKVLARHVGRGDIIPLLGMPEFGGIEQKSLHSEVNL